MRNRPRLLAQAAILAALYAVLTHLQNLLLPGSATWAIQLRLSEALCVFAFFTPAAAPGLALGCLMFNLVFSAALPLDLLVGSLATWLSARAMYLTRSRLLFGLPLPGLLLPAIFNGLLVGLELTVYMGGGLIFNIASVALGELITLLTLGLGLYLAMKRRQLHRRLFS